MSLSSRAPEQSLGLTLALASAVSNSIYLLAVRRATEDASAAQVVLVLLFFAALFNTVSFVVKVRRGGVPERSSAEGLLSRASVLLSLLTVLGNFAAGRTIELLHPAVASVLMQLQVSFAASAAYLWLGERVGLAFAFGSLISLLGVGAMQWRDGVIGTDVLAGTLWGLTSAASFAIMQVITRSVARRVDPLRFNAERLWLSVLWMALVPGQVAGLSGLAGHVVALAALAACFGPFLGRVALIYAARHLPAGLTTLIGLLSPVVVLAISVPLLGQVPRAVELWGGALVIVGTLIALRAPSARASS